MADWYTEAAEKLKKQENARLLDRTHQERTLLEQQGQRVWKQLRQWLQTEAKEFNQKVGREVLLATPKCNQELDILVKLENAQRYASVVFEEATYSVLYTAKSHGTDGEAKFEAWQMKVTPQNTVAFSALNGRERYQPLESVSSTILNGLMGWN